ncbi:MAG: hypothetical protein IK013_08360 [Bacteroidales bacterium]|nr:hypothetical protein [Bacteroidales bacterium]
MAVKGSFTLAKTKEEELLDRILADDSPVPAELLQRYAENLIKAVRAVPMHGEEAERLAEKWQANVTRFAAYKTYCAAQDIRGIAEEEGGDMDYIKAMFHAYNRYQAAEYNTAVARARTGKQWQQFSEDDNVRLFPNIKWLPSLSATPREEHMPFYNRIWPKDDPFWAYNQPGTLWNCKCDWEQTDEDPTDGNPDRRIVKPGLDQNPATSGQIFTDTASYVRRSGREGRAIVESFSPVWEHINDYLRCRDNDDYADVAFRWDNGGLKATHKGHISHDNPNEERFFPEKLSATQLENECQNILFKSGHSAILLNEITLAANGDILPALDLQMDGRLMDIRSITKNNAHTIRNVLSTKNNQIKRFVSKTGMDADTVCLYFHDSTLYSKTLITAGIEEYVDLVKTKNKIQHVICVVAGNTNVIEFNVK